VNLLPAFTASRKIADFCNQVYCCDALDLLRALPSDSVDAIVTDPPYFKVKDSAWDNQWDTAGEFIAWLKTILVEYKRVLKPNGSLYLFASPRMAARVEVAISEYFNVLNSLVWTKPYSRHNQADISGLRGYFPQTERIIFAEQFSSDETADDLSGFSIAERDLKKQLFGDEIKRAMDKTNTSTHEIVEAVGAYRDHNHGGAASNWIAGYNIPTSEQYHAIRDYLNTKAQSNDYLRREYEDLRREYEDLRRPFNASPFRPYTDVWSYRTVQAYEGKHECEKPLSMMKHIIETSTRPDSVVLDTFAGSGATLDAARRLGRKFIGCDMSAHWVTEARERVNQLYTINLFDNAAQELASEDTVLPDGSKQLSLFTQESA
jgi:site-specific DNA-methyltransferase (adenine-specific)